jgi:ribosomal protein S18 acetylase RimI-like enzyme
MHIRRLPPSRDAVERWARELWLPYNRELAEIVETHDLARDVEHVDAEVEFRLEFLAQEDHTAWVAVAGEPATSRPLAGLEADLLGFVTTALDRAPTVFDREDRLIVGDLYVILAERGTGLAETLLSQAASVAQETGCEVLTLEVDVQNERAQAFYDRMGFETYRQSRRREVGSL